MAYSKIGYIVLRLRIRQEQEKDNFIATTGEKGDGKSNCSIYIAREYVKTFGHVCGNCGHEWIHVSKAITGSPSSPYIKKILIEPCPICSSTNNQPLNNFDFEKYMAYKESDVKQKILDPNFPMFSPLIGDEAARWLFSEDWNKKENKDLKKLVIQIRTKGLILFANIPEFITIDSKYHKMTDYWIRIMQRDKVNALALFFRKDKAEIQDKWHLKDLQNTMPSYYEDTPMSKIRSIAEDIKSRIENCLDFFSIPPLPKNLSDKYKIYRNKQVFESEDDISTISKRDYAKFICYNLKNNWEALVRATQSTKFKKLTLKMITDFLLIDPKSKDGLVKFQTVSEWINDVKKHTGELY